MKLNYDDYQEVEPGVWVPKKAPLSYLKQVIQARHERDAAHALFRQKSDELLRAQQLLAESRRPLTTPESKLLEHHNL